MRLRHNSPTGRQNEERVRLAKNYELPANVRKVVRDFIEGPLDLADATALPGSREERGINLAIEALGSYLNAAKRLRASENEMESAYIVENGQLVHVPLPISGMTTVKWAQHALRVVHFIEQRMVRDERFSLVDEVEPSWDPWTQEEAPQYSLTPFSYGHTKREVSHREQARSAEGVPAFSVKKEKRKGRTVYEIYDGFHPTGKFFPTAEEAVSFLRFTWRGKVSLLE